MNDIGRQRSDADRAARAALAAVVEPDNAAVARRVLADGAEATWQSITTGDTALDSSGALRRRAATVDGVAILAESGQLDLRYICPGEAGWPGQLDVMADTLDAGAEPVVPPYGLWVRGGGDLCESARSAVAVVGSRNATRYGERVGSDLAADLALGGWTVVSGAAFGIDAAAHRGALAVGGPTVAVLACGVDVAYPSSHASLLRRIADNGVLISEVPPGSRPRRSWFLARNRIIAALTAGTVVVEAALRSGALNTASWAVKLSRHVLAVPGPVTSSLSAGCHQLIRDKGAIMVADARDVIDAVGRFGVDAAPVPPTEERPFDHLTPAQKAVREAMPRDQVASVRSLGLATGLSLGTVRAVLGELVGAGWISPDGAGWRLGGRRGDA